MDSVDSGEDQHLHGPRHVLQGEEGHVLPPLGELQPLGGNHPHDEDRRVVVALVHLRVGEADELNRAVFGVKGLVMGHRMAGDIEAGNLLLPRQQDGGLVLLHQGEG